MSQSRYIIGMSQVQHRNQNRRGAVNNRATIGDNADNPVLTATCTVVFSDPEKAGHCLSLLVSRVEYRDALSLIMQADYGCKLANMGEAQLLSLVGPLDLWACVSYAGKLKLPVVTFGGHHDLKASYNDAVKQKRVGVRGGQEDGNDLDTQNLFHMLGLATLSIR